MGERAIPDGRFRRVSRGRAAAIAGAAMLPAALAISAAVAARGRVRGGRPRTAPTPPWPRTPARTLSALRPTMRAWGTDSDGELGDGSRTPVSDTPVQVKLPGGVTVTATRAGLPGQRRADQQGHRAGLGQRRFGAARRRRHARPPGPSPWRSSCPRAPGSPRSGQAVTMTWP